ncbi:MAG: BatA domain-containing protein, partial [Planctomycetaceae bacterium]|nr:BatA domain-containing protein [Planctomycetaceae bacterium]
MFLNPWLLGGVTLIAVPIVLHLIMRQRPRHIEFPALRFVRQAKEQNRRTYQLRHWLLLFLRMAVIALLAFALARPTMQASGWLANRTAPVDAVLLFDTAAHMGYRHENRTRLDAAREIADWLLEQLPEESRVSV